MTFRVVTGARPALEFARPVELWRRAGADGLREAFERAEGALDAGRWVAGYLEYGAPSPSVVLGAFGEPQAIELCDAPAEHSPLLPLLARNEYERTVRALQASIYEGDVYQVNYTFPFALDTLGDPFALWSHYARASAAAYPAYVEDGERAIASWSPELFLSFDGARIRTKPMKGTAPPDRPEELMDAKNRAEHVMIVDLLRNDLHRVCDEVAVEQFLEIERYPTFVTMTSTVAGTPRTGTRLAEIFEATFPCGSVTGAPKRAAMRFIANAERRPRGAYCGAIGFLSPRRTGWWNVAIRTAQLDRATGTGRFDAGGGIVADSQPAAEWDEVMLKARFLRPAGRFIETVAGDADDATIEAHLARMAASARAFGVAIDPRTLRAAIERSPGRLIRLTLGFDGTPLATKELALETPAEPVRVCLSESRVRSCDPFLRHKTSWRPAHDAAAAQARERGCFDALLRNERDELTEGARTNLFARIGGQLVTPPLRCGLLPGILRERIVSEGRAQERILNRADLNAAGEVYVGNSARGLLRAEIVD